MALPGSLKENGALTSYGVPLGILAGDIRCRVVLERAPDSGGSPGTWAVIASLPPGPQIYIDIRPNDGATWWYRFKHSRSGYTDSGYTGQVSSTPKKLAPERVYALPDYPLPRIDQETPPTRPGNAIVRVRGWPEHSDTVFRYAYLALTDTVPARSTSTTDWTTYTSEVELARDVSLNRKIAAWGDLNGIRGPVVVTEVGPDLRAQITSSTATETGSSPNVHVKRSIEVDIQTMAVRFYRRKGNWPTKDDTQTGALEPDYLKGDVTAADAWQFEDGGWATSDVVYDIMVPLDTGGNEGPRLEASYTVTATASPQITDAWWTQTAGGTGCSPTSLRRKIKVEWRTSGVTDGSHDMRIYRRVLGSGFSKSWSLVSTETSPVTNQSYTDEAPMYAATPPEGDGYFAVDYRLDLWDGANVDDSQTLAGDSFAGWSCG